MHTASVRSHSSQQHTGGCRADEHCRTRGAGGDAMLNAMKGQVFESPRGPMLVDEQTHELV